VTNHGISGRLFLQASAGDEEYEALELWSSEALKLWCRRLDVLLTCHVPRATCHANQGGKGLARGVERWKIAEGKGARVKGETYHQIDIWSILYLATQWREVSVTVSSHND